MNEVIGTSCVTNSVQTVTVAYRTWPWILVAVRSFQKHFPDQTLLVVNNNPGMGDANWHPRCATETAWLQEQTDLIVIQNEGPNRSAGDGIDVGLGYCRSKEIDVLVHIEPDCVISGRSWFEALLSALDRGAWMAGTLRRFYGPIHPTPSVWRTDVAWSSFGAGKRLRDVEHPQYSSLFHEDELLAWVRIHEPHAWDWWREYWDTAQRNWFIAACQDRAGLVDATGDFEHFWYGSQRAPDFEDERLKPYLAEIITEVKS